MAFFDYPSFRRSTSHSQIYSAFPDPFDDYSSMVRPRDLPNVLKWAEFLWSRLPAWRMAGRRVIRYFLTSLKLSRGSEDERKRYDEFLTKTLKVTQELALIGDEFFTYGNSFSTVYMPFRRYLRCPKCKLERIAEKVEYRFENMAFAAKCPKCGRDGEHAHVDRRSTDESKLKLIRWSPHELNIRFHPLSHRSEFLWNVPGDLREALRRGDRFYIEDTPWEIIQTAHKEHKFKFNDGIVYHMKEPTLAGIQNRGWGIPSILYNFGQAYHIQTLRRYDEAIAMDYIVPFRLLTPKAKVPEGDPMKDMRLGDFNYHMMQMLDEHRYDPTSWHAVPFPVEYQAVGGEGRSLAPTEQTSQAMDELLNASGYPAEMYRGTIQVQAAPTALRLFQQTWTHLVAYYNDWLNWLLDTLAVGLNWERITGEFQPVTLADDLEKRQLQMQLAAGGMISRGTALATLGLDIYEETRKKIEEQMTEAREVEKAQRSEAERRESEARIQGMLGQPEGMPGGVVTPMSVVEEAEQMASQLFAMPDPRMRRNYITNLKRQNPTLHALVTARLDDMRQEAAAQGQQMIQAQAAGGMMM